MSLQENLFHLDLSYNYFSIKEIENISQGLINNHTLLGLHMQNNNCEVNSNGFLVLKPNSNETSSGILFKRIFKEEKFSDNC